MPQPFPIRRPAVTLRVALQLALLCAGLAAAWPGRAAPQVDCHFTYGGETRVLSTRPVAEPLGVATLAIGSYFLVRPVLMTRPRQTAAFKLYTYADREPVPVLIHQLELPWPPPRPQRAGSGFTGLQRVYEPVRDGELLYWCEQVAAPDRAEGGR